MAARRRDDIDRATTELGAGVVIAWWCAYSRGSLGPVGPHQAMRTSGWHRDGF